MKTRLAINRRTLSALPAVLTLVLATACASWVPPPAPLSLFHDELFGADPRPPDAEQVFALSAEMRDYLARELEPRLRRTDKRRGLLELLYTQQPLRLDYDAEITRTAAEAFAARRGNCLSLVLMTAAFAKALDLPVRYNDVAVDELWWRSGQLQLASGHVNLSLGRPLLERSRGSGEPDMLTVDFLPSEQLRGQRSRAIDERTVVAMYLNNRAAEQLMADRTPEAYWWARAAIVQAPQYLAAHNTLAVIYRRQGRPDLAEALLRRTLDQEPSNVQALANLILVLRDQGRGEESEQVAQRLARLQPDPPYKFFDLGVVAMRARDYREAKRLFAREIDRMAYAPEPHFWLALAHLALGEREQARQQLTLAREYSATDGERGRYSAKLEALARGG